MDREIRKYYTKLLDINPKWLIQYLTDMIVENDDEFEEAIKFKDRDSVSNIIEKYIY